jgi:hypothetical protein
VRVYAQVVVERPCPRCGFETVTPLPVDAEQVCADCATVEAVGPVGVRLATSTGVYLAALLHARAALRMGYVGEARDVLEAVETSRPFDRAPLPRRGGPRQRARPVPLDAPSS